MSIDVTMMGEVDEVDEVFTCPELAARPVMCSIKIYRNLDMQ